MTKYFFPIVLFLVVFSSCVKDRTPIDNPTTANMNQLVVPNNFDWKTTTQYNFKISATQNGIVEIRSDEGLVFHKLNYVTGKDLELNLSLPTYLKKIQVMHLGRIIEMPLADNKLDIQFDQ